LQRIFDEFAGPNSVDVRGDGATPDHWSEPSANDVVFEGDIVLGVLGLFASESFGLFKKIGKPRVKRNLRAAVVKDFVIQATHFPRKDVGEEMVEISDFRGEVIAPFLIVFSEFVGLLPKGGLIDTEAPEKGRLHVFGNQGFIEIPDAGDGVLSKKSRGHGGWAERGIPAVRSGASHP